MPLVLTERVDSILRLTLNRPRAMNALRPDLVEEITNVFLNLEEEVRVVVISGGEGRFCAGLDLKSVVGLDDAGRLDYVELVKDCFLAILGCPVPVIAEIDGPALAGGFDLAVVCDFRCASTRASFGQPEINLGFTQLIDPLWKIIGLGPARELAMTGRIYGPDGAQSLGLLTRLASPEELVAKTMELALELAGKDRQALAATKRLCQIVPGMPPEEAVEAQVRVFKESVTKPGAMAGAREYLKKVGIKAEED